ncbi:hypothetical protein EG329_007120 [Mollisiaceae sp. DMI_Dod_QoI]|nr:hypothetical protein EG329_007120 [Helotiales sp. DMI_Dod_QoI]
MAWLLVPGQNSAKILREKHEYESYDLAKGRVSSFGLASLQQSALPTLRDIDAMFSTHTCDKNLDQEHQQRVSTPVSRAAGPSTTAQLWPRDGPTVSSKVLEAAVLAWREAIGSAPGTRSRGWTSRSWNVANLVKSALGSESDLRMI